MLRIDRKSRQLQALIAKTLPESGLTERGDLQMMIRNSPDAFFAEMGEKLLLLGEEVKPTELVDDRIDLLALDPHGAVVVIELKRGSHKLHLLQALGYAATVAKWSRNRLLELRARLTNRSLEEAEEELEEFLLDSAGSLNQTQRVILVAEDFDYMVLATAEWLTEKFDVDVRCYRVKLSADGAQEYLACTCIYPPPELAQHADARVRRPGSIKPPRWQDWDKALAGIPNAELVAFYKAEIAAGRPNYLRRRLLHFNAGDRRRLFIVARKKLAYAWQHRRFDGDVEFWQKLLSQPGEVQPVKDGRCLRFFLVTAEDFRRFKEAIIGPFQTKVFSGPGGPDLDDEDADDTDDDAT